MREDTGYNRYLGILERPAAEISINILRTFPHGTSALPCTCKTLRLTLFPMLSCVTHVASLSVQTILPFKETYSPITSW